MYYRRRLLLALLQALGGRTEKMRLHKLLLLFMQRRGEAAYSFVTYSYGAFSFQANADMVALTTRGLMANHDKEWELLDSEDHGAALKPADRAVLRMVLEAYGTQGRDALVRETYIRYPYTAIRSKMAERLLDTAQLVAVANALPPAGPEGLYTIGYEGLDLDAFLN